MDCCYSRTILDLPWVYKAKNRKDMLKESFNLELNACYMEDLHQDDGDDNYEENYDKGLSDEFWYDLSVI